MSDEKNYWPYGIVTITLAVVGLIVWTINMVASAPTEDDRSYFMSYHDVDEKINDIREMEYVFKKKYLVTPVSQSLDMGENRLQIRITDISGDDIENAQIKTRITRPHTNQDDIELGDMSYTENGNYLSKPFKIEKQGRWKVESLVTVQGESLFYAQDINTTGYSL